MNNLQKHIIHTLLYFAFFQYAPTFEEVYTFLPIKISKERLKKELEPFFQGGKYTLGEYSNYIKKQNQRHKISLKKLEKIQIYLRLLSLFPQIKLVGLSGSVAMMNANDDDDIDLFIISTAGRMWTARVVGLFLAHIMGLRRKRHQRNVKDKICLNLFFDEKDLKLPKQKQTEYGAHEVLQMKPVVDKDYTHLRYLDENRWVCDIFPNARFKLKKYSTRHYFPFFILKLISGTIEQILKRIQLSIIRRHQTQEIITDTQLWFFPEDFEKKIK